MGTHVLLEKDEKRLIDELYCKNEKYYDFAAKTSKILKVSRVLLKDKAPEPAVLLEKESKELKSQLEVAVTYEKALNRLLAQGRTQPRRIAKDFNAENLLSPVTANSHEKTDE